MIHALLEIKIIRSITSIVLYDRKIKNAIISLTLKSTVCLAIVISFIVLIVFSMRQLLANELSTTMSVRGCAQHALSLEQRQAGQPQLHLQEIVSQISE